MNVRLAPGSTSGRPANFRTVQSPQEPRRRSDRTAGRHPRRRARSASHLSLHELPPPPAGVAHWLRGLPSSGERPAIFTAMLWLVGLALGLGTVMVFSASSVESLILYGSPLRIFEKQAIYVVLGLIALSVTVRVDYRRWRRLAVVMLLGSVLALMAVLVPGVGIGSGGASRWLGAGSLRVQPSEVAKLAVLVYVADMLARRQRSVSDWRQSVRPVAILLGVVGMLLMMQPDMGTSLVVALIAFTLLWAAGVQLRALGALVSMAVVGVLVLGWAAPYRRARLLSFLDPWQHKLTSGFQVTESLVGFSVGHVTGVGLGASPLKWGLLPNPYTDFIFSVVGSELGLLGSVAIVVLFAAIGWWGIRIASAAPDCFGTLLAAGVTAWLVGQATINMGAVVGLLPVTGIPLPFISFGGSSLVIEMAATGMMLNVAARSGRQPNANGRKG